jgi:RNA-binding protein YlmH
MTTALALFTEIRILITKQDDDKWFLAHISDLADQAARGGYAAFSDFLDDHQRGLLSQLEGRLPSCLALFGGYPDAERVIAVLYPDYLQDSVEDMAAGEIAVLKISPADRRFLKRPLEHRDYLGAVMGTGIKREKTGDLLTKDSSGYLLVKDEIADYLIDNLASVGPAVVSVERIGADQLPPPEKGVESVVSVASMRIDTLVSHGFRMGRGEAVKLISQGLVTRNGLAVTKADSKGAVGDRISARGHGKMKILEDRGLSRSGRLQLKIEVLGFKK